ncbi:MAG: GNAT family N-acetyltransferase [Nitrosopumilaceae archaeon]|nr:GNAT family N-acetyltransferase [Nitrosopumilaceae archaeon]
MKIRLANPSDRPNVMKFCRDTFSWGDYIDEAWDHWIKDGNLFLIENDFPVGIAHANFSGNQVWIEGIRIDPNYRRNHYASTLIKKIETLAKEKGKLFSFMITDEKNIPSINMAKKCGFNSTQIWKFYTMIPKTCTDYSVNFVKKVPKHVTHYVKSWRWLPLDDSKITKLGKENRIITSEQDNDISSAVLVDSSRFGKTLVVTFFSGDEFTTRNVLCYIQNFAFCNNYSRIEILSKENLTNFDSLELKNSFILFEKLL